MQRLETDSTTAYVSNSGQENQQATYQINWAVLPIFAIPLLLVLGALQYGQKFTEPLSDNSQLEQQLKLARLDGLPLAAKELVTNVPDGENSQKTITKLYGNRDESEFSDLTRKPIKEIPKRLDPKFERYLAKAEAVGKYTKFDQHYDFDLGYQFYIPNETGIQKALDSLLYSASHQAEHGDPAHAVDLILLARNVCRQSSNCQSIGAIRFHNSLVRKFYEESAKAGIRLKDDKARQKLIEVLTQELPIPSFERALQGEFYQGVTFLRNMHQVGGIPSRVNQYMYDESGPMEVEPTDLVRKGLPKTVLGQAMLAKHIERHRRLLAIAREEPDAVRASNRMAQYLETVIDQPVPLFLTEFLDEYPSTLKSGLKLKTYQALALWAIEIGQKYHGNWPASLESRPDPGYGGHLFYQRVDKCFVLRSTGADKKEGKLMMRYNQKPTTQALFRMNGDDFGKVYPYEPEPKLTADPSRDI